MTDILLSTGIVETVSQAGGASQLPNLDALAASDLSQSLGGDGTWCRITGWVLAKDGLTITSQWIQMTGFDDVASVTTSLPQPFPAPSISAAAVDNSAAFFVVTGKSLLSLLYTGNTPPGSTSSSSVAFTKTGGATTPAPASLTVEQILAAGGTVTSSKLSIPVSVFSQIPVTGNTVQVTANGQTSNAFVVL